MLTDLEIRKAISMIVLVKQFPLAKSIEFDKIQNCYWVESAGFTSWPLLNPLEDDALCFQLMTRYEISLNYDFKGCTNRYVCFHDKHIATELSRAETASKAVCLAVIKIDELTRK